jgi:uncharacterized protein
MPFGDALLHALNMTLVMTWEILWALVLGFTLSGVIQAVMSKGEMSRLLPDSVPLAAVLWAGGISFGGVIAFIFADLLILPILNIYRKYYGTRIAVILGLVFYAAMAGAAYVIEILFGLAGLVPQDRSIDMMQHGITLNYTTVRVIALAVSAVLVWRFMRTGGPEMLAHMESPDQDHACHQHGHGHAHHHHHG